MDPCLPFSSLFIDARRRREACLAQDGLALMSNQIPCVVLRGGERMVGRRLQPICGLRWVRRDLEPWLNRRGNPSRCVPLHCVWEQYLHIDARADVPGPILPYSTRAQRVRREG